MKRSTLDRTLSFLDSISRGLLLFELNGRYRHAFMMEGSFGVRRLLAAEERREINRRLDDAKRRGHVTERRIGKRLIISLTERGLETLNRKALGSAARLTDGRRVCVMYDIPERFRPARDRLRTILKRAGFIRHQHSVWRTDRDVALLINIWIKRHKLKKWVDVYVT